MTTKEFIIELERRVTQEVFNEGGGYFHDFTDMLYNGMYDGSGLNPNCLLKCIIKALADMKEID